MGRLENKTKHTLDLRELYKFDKKTAFHTLGVIERLRRKKLSEEELQEIYKQGVQVLFRGSQPIQAEEQTYALFYPDKISKDLPVKLKVGCYFGRSSHPEIIDNGSPIVLGTLVNDKFSYFSSTWMKQAPHQSPAYTLGTMVNEMMLNHFNLD